MATPLLLALLVNHSKNHRERFKFSVLGAPSPLPCPPWAVAI